MVDLLLEAGADVNAQSPEGVTALMNIAQRQDVSFPASAVAERLLSRGARVNAHEVHNMTALHFAAARGKKDLVRLLLDHGALVVRHVLPKDIIAVARSQGFDEIATMLETAARREEADESREI